MQALHFLGRINNASALQPAACHGSFGFDVGAGMASLTPPSDNALLQAQLAGPDGHTSNLTMPRLWLAKGLPLPVDLGVSAGAPSPASKTGFTQVSGHLQWTLYQALARPALALRANYGKLYGITGTSVTSAGGEAVASYGVLRYFTLYGRLGASQNRGQLVTQPGSPGAYLLAHDEAQWQAAANWTEWVRAAGLKIQFGSSLMALTGEADLSQGTARADYAVKLSYEL